MPQFRGYISKGLMAPLRICFCCSQDSGSRFLRGVLAPLSSETPFSTEATEKAHFRPRAKDGANFDISGKFEYSIGKPAKAYSKNFLGRANLSLSDTGSSKHIPMSAVEIKPTVASCGTGGTRCTLVSSSSYLLMFGSSARV